MNPHDINDRFGLLLHRIFAERIRHEPGLRAEALKMIKEAVADHGGTLGQRMWLQVFKKPWETAEALMLADTTYGKLLRSNSPFATLIGFTDFDQRIALWRQAKAELLAEKDSNSFERSFLRNIHEADGSAARAMLLAGRPVHIRRTDTPPGHVIRIHPNGQEELVHVDSDYAKRQLSGR